MACQCPARLTSCFRTGNFLAVPDSSQCILNKDSLLEAKYNTTTAEYLISPDKREAFVQVLSDAKRCDHSLKIKNLKKQLLLEVEALKSKLAYEAVERTRDNVSSGDAFDKLFEVLEQEALPYSKVLRENGELSAVYYHDPQLVEPDFRNIDIYLLTSDVTHSVFLPICGLTKLSCFCYIDASRCIRPIGII